MYYLFNLVLIAINIAFYLSGLSKGLTYWWNMVAAGFIGGLMVASYITTHIRR